MRKQLLVMGFTVVMGLTVLPTKTYAKNPVRVVVNNRTVNFPDALPFVDDSERIQVPVRFVSEALGATVEWDQEKQQVTVTRATNTAKLKIGEKSININGKAKTLDTEAMLIDTRTFVPVRFVSEALGATVEWEEATYTVNISIEKTGAIIEVNGYMVPDDTDILVANTKEDKNTQTVIAVDWLNPNWEKQLQDLHYALEQKFGAGIANEVVNHISKKQSRWAEVPEKIIHVESTDQDIEISGSRSNGVVLYVGEPGYRAGSNK